MKIRNLRVISDINVALEEGYVKKVDSTCAVGFTPHRWMGRTLMVPEVLYLTPKGVGKRHNLSEIVSYEAKAK